MADLLFCFYNTKFYYRQDDTIYDYQYKKVKSEILNDSTVKYYRFDDILDNIDSLPTVVNIIYKFQSTYAIFSTRSDNILKVITIEDLEFDIGKYVPYDYFLLYPLPSHKKFPLFNVFLMDMFNDTENKLKLSRSNFDIEHIVIDEYFIPKINLKTGLPESILYHGYYVNFIDFIEFQKMLITKRIYRYNIDNEVQKWAKSPNTILTVFGINGITYLLNAKYIKEENKILPPF